MNSVHEQFMNCSRIIRELQNNISQGGPHESIEDKSVFMWGLEIPTWSSF